MNAFNRIGKLIALGFGTGLSPVAPGTAGSLAAVAIYYLVARYLAPGASGGADAAFYLLAGAILAGAPLGVWATGLLVTPEEPDPGRAVWDEFVGMWITCLLLPPNVLWLAAAFVCFRIFDVLKPWPGRRLERLPGGWGIMADDVAAGLYGAILLNAIHLAGRLWG